jgi:hypothetical protein
MTPAALRPMANIVSLAVLFSLRITCAQHAAIPLMPPLLLNEHAIITQFLPGLLRSTDQFLFPSITIAKSHSRPKYNVVQRSPLLSLGRRVL